MTKPSYAHEVVTVLVEDDHVDEHSSLSKFPFRGAAVRYQCKRCGIIWEDTGHGTFGFGVMQIGDGDREKCRVPAEVGA